MATIDNLEINISARFTTAVRKVDDLVKKLETLDKQLSSLNVGVLSDMAQGVNALSNAMSNFDSSGVKNTDFTKIANGLGRLGKINLSGINKMSEDLNRFLESVSKFSAIQPTISNVTGLVKALNKFGGASAQRAIQNIPLLSKQLKELFQTLSTLPYVNPDVVELVNSLSALASQGGKIGTATNALSNSLNGFGRSASTATRHTFSLSRAFGKFYASFFLVIRGIKSLWRSTENAMNYVETFNYLNQSLKSMGAKQAKNYEEIGEQAAKGYYEGFKNSINDLNKKISGYELGSFGELVNAGVKNIGLDPNQVMNFQARIGAMTTSVGLLGDTSLQAQKTLTMLSADLSSMANIDLDQVMDNLSSGLMGMSRSLYKYGIDITQASLATLAAEQGITKSVTQMSQAEKMQLRLLKILQDSQVAWGDQIRTIDSVANSYRIFKMQIQNAGRVLGNLFLPILGKVLPVVNGLVVALGRLFETLGFKIYGDGWLKDVMSLGQSGAVNDLSDFTDGMDDFGDSMDDASGSAKKLKQQLQGFDELNVLTSKEDSGKSAVGGLSFDLSGAIGDALKDYESIWDKYFSEMENKVEKYANKFKEVFAPVQDFITHISIGDFFSAGRDVSQIVANIFDAFSKAIESVDWEKIGRKIGDFLDGIDWTKILQSAGNFLSKLWEAAVKLWSASFKSAPIETAIATALFASKFLVAKTVMSTKLASLIPSQLSIGKTIALVGITWKLGLEIGKELGKILFPDDKAFYESFNFDSVVETFRNTDAKDLKNAFDDMVKSAQDYDFSKIGKEVELKALDPVRESLGKAKGDFAYQTIDINQTLTSGMSSAATDSMTEFIRKFNIEKSDIDKLFDEKNWTFDGVSKGLSKTFDSLSFQTKYGMDAYNALIKAGNGKFFASGGFPRSADVFFANENGIPELVGTIGGKTAVVSNNEISGISNAVYSTGEQQASLLSTAVSLLQVIAQNGGGRMSDEEIFNSFRRSATQYTNRTGNPAIPV